MIDEKALDAAIRRFPYRLRMCQRAAVEKRRAIMRPVYDAICLEYRAILREGELNDGR